MNWHVPPATLIAYARDAGTDADAWSVEAHLINCEPCRNSLADVPSLGDVLDARWDALAAQLPAQGRSRPGSWRREARVLVGSGPAARLSWIVACLLVLGVAVLAASTSEPGRIPWVGVLAPAVVVLGVAVSYGTGLDDSYEIIASTSNGGLRLVLIRTVSVLAVTVPVALIANVLTGYGSPVPWLVATLALTLLSLAVGSVIGVTRAAVIVGTVWTLAAGAPLFGDSTSAMLAPEAVPVWLALSVVTAVIVGARRGAFNQLPLRTGGEVPT